MHTHDRGSRGEKGRSAHNEEALIYNQVVTHTLLSKQSHAHMYTHTQRWKHKAPADFLPPVSFQADDDGGRPVGTVMAGWPTTPNWIDVTGRDRAQPQPAREHHLRGWEPHFTPARPPPTLLPAGVQMWGPRVRTARSDWLLCRERLQPRSHNSGGVSLCCLLPYFFFFLLKTEKPVQ